MLRFYFFPGACSLASHIALEESGVDFDAIAINLAQQEQRSEKFLAVNPKGRVPVLETPDGILTENLAILLYVAMLNPEADLAPLNDAYRLASMQAFNAYLSSTVHVAHAHGPRGIRWADDPASLADMKRKVPETMSACFQLIEDEYLAGPWVLGEDYSVADGYLFTLASWLKADGVDPGAYPKVTAHTKAMLDRPAVQQVLDRERIRLA